MEADIFFDLNKCISRTQTNSYSFGKIYKIQEKESNKLFLAKVTDEIASQEINEISKAIKELSKLNHPAILKYVGISPIDFNKNPVPTIIIENALTLTLYELIQYNKSKHIFNNTLKLMIVYGIASAMSYLHSHNIIHENLQSLNIVFSNFFLPKITNYSISKFTTKQNGFSIKNHTSFIAPETVKKLELTKSSNVYSFGITIYEIFTNDLPPIIFKFLFHSNIPSPYLNLIKSCISQDPQKRPTFDEILDQLKNNHDFIIENVNEKDFSDYVNYIEKSLNGSNVEQFINLKSKTFNDFNDILSPFDKNKNKFIDLDQFYILNRIGEGGYGKCFLVKEANTNKKYVAKVLKKQISNDYMHNEETLLFFREVKLMSILNHPSIIKFIGFSPVDFNQSFHPVIITQFAKNKI